MRHCFCQSASAVMFWFQTSVFSSDNEAVLETVGLRAQDQVVRYADVSVRAYPYSLETQLGGSEKIFLETISAAIFLG